MKKNWRQGLPLILSVVLLLVAVLQGSVIHGLRKELAAGCGALDELAERLDEMETVKAVQSEPAVIARFVNATVNVEGRMLTVDIAAELPDDADSFPGIGLCCVGEPYQAAWQASNLSRQADGTYVGTLTFPLDLDMDIELRLEDNTVLYSGPVTALLPVQMKDGGVSWHYDCALQKFYLLDCVPTLADLKGRDIQAADGMCRVYRNGELVVEGQYFRGLEDPAEDENPEEGFAVSCAPGDHIRLCYACTDEFGLRYEFPLKEWAAQRWDDAVFCPLSACPAVTWPE